MIRFLRIQVTSVQSQYGAVFLKRQDAVVAEAAGKSTLSPLQLVITEVNARKYQQNGPVRNISKYQCRGVKRDGLSIQARKLLTLLRFEWIRTRNLYLGQPQGKKAGSQRNVSIKIKSRIYQYPKNQQINPPTEKPGRLPANLPSQRRSRYPDMEIFVVSQKDFYLTAPDICYPFLFLYCDWSFLRGLKLSNQGVWNFNSELFPGFRPMKYNQLSMVSKRALVYFVLLVLAIAADPMKINYVSASSQNTYSVVQSSILGNKNVYINIEGFDSNGKGNDATVTVGTYPCIIISDLTKDGFIVCTTTTCTNKADYGLALSLTVKNKNQAVTYNNAVSYTNASTATITQLFPTSGVANQTVASTGQHKTSDVVATDGDQSQKQGDTKIEVGSNTCARNNVTQEAISGYNSNQKVNCKLDQEVQAGNYNITEKNKEYGNADTSALKKPTLQQNDSSQFTYVSAITNVTNNGSDDGHQIEIRGSSFSKNCKNNSVDVDGQECKVTQCSSTYIKCTLPKKDNSSARIDTNTTQTQFSSYFHGGGLQYFKYNGIYHTDTSLLAATFRNGNLGTAAEETVKTQIKSPDTTGSFVGQIWRGYFTAPANGTYRFSGIGQYSFSFYLSNVHGSAELPATPLIYSNQPQINWNNFHHDNVVTATATVDLIQNKSYYLQAYHLSYYYGGSFKIIAEIPNNNTKLDYQVHQVDEFVLNATHQPQTMTYSMVNGTSGTINLKILRRSPYYFREVNITYGCSWYEFYNAIYSFDCFWPHSISGNMTMFDSAGKATSELSKAARIDYNVSFYLLRPTECQTQKFTVTYYDYKGKFLQNQTVKHSPLITGTFSLSINGNSLNKGKIPYNVDAPTLQSYINAIPGYESVVVDYTTSISPSYGCRWVISYKGRKERVNISLNTMGLTGGITSPKVFNNTLRNTSTSIMFDGLSYSFLAAPSNLPTVRLSVNSVLAVCYTNCSYTIRNIFKITNLSLIGTKLRILLANFTNLANFINISSVPLSQISIQAGNVSCLLLANLTNITALNITCQLPTNYDGSPQLPAGNLTFQVFIPGIGYIGLGAGVQPILVPFAPTSLQKLSGLTNGGYSNSILGSGFPANNQTISLLSTGAVSNGLSIVICGVSANILFTSNTRINFVVPPCTAGGNMAVNITYGSNSNNSLIFTYLTPSVPVPTIDYIFPNSSNPMIKSTLNIVGKNFGANSSAFNVYLTNSSGRVYQLKVITSNNSYIRCGLSGGLPGNFTVNLNYPDSNGNAVPSTSGADQFTYVSQISSVSPNNGSIYGGTLLTITGKNFSPAPSDTLVYIGYTLNWFCSIQSINQTVITCLTPPISLDYGIAEQLDVVISTKLTYFNACPLNNCSFSYLSFSYSPNVTNISISYHSWGAVVAVNGANFTTTAVYSCSFRFRSLLTGNVTTLPALNCFDPYDITVTSSMANITIPFSLPAGRYYVSVVNQYGESNPQQLDLNWVIGNFTLPIGSTEGSYNYISGGSFYPPSLDQNYGIVFNSSVPLVQQVQVVQCCSNNTLQLYFPPAPSGTVFTLTFNYELTSSSLTYSVSSGSTPNLNILTPSNLVISAGSNAFSISTGFANGTGITPNNITFVSTINSSDVIVVSSWAGNASFSNFTANLPSGSYTLRVNSTSGYFLTTAVIKVKTNTVTSTNQNISFAGTSFTITGNALSPSSYLTINGYRANIVSYSSSSATYQIPSFVTVATQSQFNLASPDLIDASKYTLFSDQGTSSLNGYAFDQAVSTSYTSGNTQCWIGIDFGSLFAANISRIRFYPNNYWNVVVSYLLTAQFQGSNDNINWTTIATIDSSVHSAWNIILPQTNTPFRYVRFLHNSTSQCSLAEIQFYGTVYNIITPSLTSQPSGLTYYDGYSTFNLSSSVYFRSDRTPMVTSVSPTYGDIFGGYNLTLTGSNLNFSTNISIRIDNIPCLYVSSTSAQIVCLVGARPNIPPTNTFTVTIAGNVAILQAQFLYVLKWSDDRTWGVDLPPIDDDLVYVPAGMTLLVDQNTPKLAGIAVQNGTIIFANNTNLTVTTAFIEVIGGRFIAGTEQQPLNSNLTFVLTGGYYDAQQPIGGNKMIFCLECKFSMYGLPRVAWTTLAGTITPNSTVLVVSQDVDWKVGERIVVASTSFNHKESQDRIIVSVVGRNITVNSPFINTHVSVNQTYPSGDSVVMQAEVALLTRNIKVTGDPTSNISKYGAHLMLAGQSINGFEAKVAYSEFTLCGQPQIVGRYCIYFNTNGDAPSSYARGNSVHQSFARVVAVHASHFITIENNVGYKAAGHNFMLQDGIQTHNLFQNNLAISSLSANNMLQSDIMVSSFYIRHPNNYFIGNRAAGSDYYGFNFDLPDYPTGSSASKDICPPGNPLASFTNNVAHSNTFHGLRINNLIARTYPCSDTKNEYDPNYLWSANPSIPTVFSSFLSYKNLKHGFVAENAGNYILTNFTVAENLFSGISVYVANYTKQYIQINNSVVIGQSLNNIDTTAIYGGLYGLVTPNTGSSNVTNVRFYNYPNGSSAFVTCAQCDTQYYSTNIGTEVFVQKLKFYSINGSYLFMLGAKKDMIYDSDGSFSTYFNGVSTPTLNSTLVYAYNHITFDNPYHCFSPSNALLWDNLTLCDNSVIIRRITITNVIGANYWYNFYYATMFVAPIANSTVPVSALNSSAITSVGATFPRLQKPFSWSLPYVAGTKYTVWWSSDDDFSHISITTTPRYLVSDPGIAFKFAYNISRQLFSIGPMRGYVFPDSTLVKVRNVNYLDVNNCLNGDYYHNNDNTDVPSLRMLEVCQSGKNRTVYEYTEVNAIFCKYLCPAPVVTVTPPCSGGKQLSTRKWSQPTQWPNGVVPQTGDNVTISCRWTILLDVNPPALGYLLVDGTILIDDNFDVNITAKFIHIRSGTINVGTNGSPYTHSLTIQINGQQSDNSYSIDQYVSGNKFLVITGGLSLYGVKPSTQMTYLTQTALQGSRTIYVAASSDWKVGDELSLSPSFTNQSEYEKVKISAINPDGSLNLTSPLQFTHFGAPSATISNNYGTLDARTMVGHLTRNIKIVSGGDTNWGYSVFVYGYNDGATRVGNAVFDGVQFQSGGQITSQPTLQILGLTGTISPTQISGSSFHNCLQTCINVQDAQQVSITSNIFYNIAGTGVQVTRATKGFTFTSNLIVGATDAGFVIYQANDNTYVTENVCQGSKGYGFIIPQIGCDQVQNSPYGYNTAGSCSIGFLLTSIKSDCQAFSYLSAYACGVGQIANPPDTTTLNFTNFILADNQLGAVLRFGSSLKSTDNSAYFQNSYITAVSRPNCDVCYSATVCNSLTGLRMLTVTASGSNFDDFNGQFDAIYDQELLDAKAYLTNVTFDNFRQSYPAPTYASSVASACGSNFAMKTHPQAVDLTAGHYLFTSNCTNCDNSSYIYCDANNPAYLGSSGGCGDILCTGKSNYIVLDWNGTFFGNTSTILPNNTLIGNNEANCTFSPTMNGHLCQRSDLVVLEYQSQAPDYNSRIMWPVNLTANSSNYTTVVNGWREWNWQGSTPMGTRLGRFVSVVKLFSVYNITFSSTPPLQLAFQLQRSSPDGNNSRWTMVKIYYPLPNSIEVSVGGVPFQPIIMTNTDGSGLRRQINTSVCGDNIFYFSNRTIQFVVTEDPNCVVTITLSDSIQLTTHFAMNASDFFSDTVMSGFISNLCALLNIQDQSRVKVVGVYAGSAIVDVYIAANGSVAASPGADPTQVAIAAALSQAISNGSFASSMQNVVGYQVIQASSTFSILPIFSTPTTTTNATSASSSSENQAVLMVTSNPKFIIGIIAGAVVILFGMTILLCYIYKKYKAAQEEIANQQDQKEEVIEEKEQSHAIVMSDQVLFGNDSHVASPTREESPKKLKRNRRVRQRQTLEVIQFD